MAGEYVRARLRQKDQDLREWIEDRIARGHDEADLVRAGLRLLMAQEDPAPLAVPLEKPRSVPVPAKKAPKLVQVSAGEENSGSSIDELLGKF